MTHFLTGITDEIL
jgi:Zn-dependent M16 (insulinase) family peptidase